MLKLSARVRDKNAWGGAVLGICVNGVEFATLRLEPDEADELVWLLNAAGELLELVEEVAEMSEWHGTVSDGCTCLACRARKVVAKTKGGCGRVDAVFGADSSHPPDVARKHL